MPRNGVVAVAAQQGVLLPAGLAAVVDEVRNTVLVALIGDDADVAPLKGHDIPRLPLGDLVGVGGQAFGISLKKHPQIGDPAEIDVGIGRALHTRVKGGIFRNIGVDQCLEVVARILKGAPHHIGADAPVLRRVAPGKVAGAIGGAIFGILPGAQQDIGVVIDAVAVGVQGALQLGDAQLIGGRTADAESTARQKFFFLI